MTDLFQQLCFKEQHVSNHINSHTSYKLSFMKLSHKLCWPAHEVPRAIVPKSTRALQPTSEHLLDKVNQRSSYQPKHWISEPWAVGLTTTILICVERLELSKRSRAWPWSWLPSKLRRHEWSAYYPQSTTLDHTVCAFVELSPDINTICFVPKMLFIWTISSFK